MKTLISASLVALALSPVAFARGGGDSGNGLTPGSTAWIASETIEHALRALAAQDATTAERIESVSSQKVTDTNWTVTVDLDDGQRVFACLAFQEARRGGIETHWDINCVP